MPTEKSVHIKRYAGLAVMFIWIAGLLATACFLAIPSFDKELFTGNEKSVFTFSIKTNKKVHHVEDDLQLKFPEKTALVNVGLRLSSSPGSDYVYPNGSIKINKLFHDQKLKQSGNGHNNNQSKVFSIKAVPK